MIPGPPPSTPPLKTYKVVTSRLLEHIIEGVAFVECTQLVLIFFNKNGETIRRYSLYNVVYWEEQ